MLKLNNNIRIKNFDYSYSDLNNCLLSVYLNTFNTIISSPKILLLLGGLNGTMTEDEWIECSTKILNISKNQAQNILSNFRSWNIIYDVENVPYSNVPISQNEFVAKNNAQTILIHEINSVTEYIVAFLYMFGFKKISFLKDIPIEEELTINSLHFSCQDIGKSFVETLNSKLQSHSIVLNNLQEEFTIIIEPTCKHSFDDKIAFSSFSYANMRNFGECKIFDEIKNSSMLIYNICNAFHLVEDILYSIQNGTVN